MGSATCAEAAPVAQCWHGSCVNNTCVCNEGWSQSLEFDFWQADRLDEMQKSKGLCNEVSWLPTITIYKYSALIGYILVAILLLTGLRNARLARRQLPVVIICFLCAVLSSVHVLLPKYSGAKRALFLGLFGVTQAVCIMVTSSTQRRYLRYLSLQSETAMTITKASRLKLVWYNWGIKIIQITSWLAIPFFVASPLVQMTKSSLDLFLVGMVCFIISNLGLSLLGGTITFIVLSDLRAVTEVDTTFLRDPKMQEAAKKARRRLARLVRLSISMGIFDFIALILTCFPAGIALLKYFFAVHICFVQIFYATSRFTAKGRRSKISAKRRVVQDTTEVNPTALPHFSVTKSQHNDGISAEIIHIPHHHHHHHHHDSADSFSNSVKEGT